MSSTHLVVLLCTAVLLAYMTYTLILVNTWEEESQYIMLRRVPIEHGNDSKRGT